MASNKAFLGDRDAALTSINSPSKYQHQQQDKDCPCQLRRMLNPKVKETTLRSRWKGDNPKENPWRVSAPRPKALHL